jgi:hypothetical protein
MKQLKSKKAFLYDARLGKSGFISTRIINSNYALSAAAGLSNSISATVQDVAIAPGANGAPDTEVIISTLYLSFTAAEIDAAESSFTVVKDDKLADFTEKVILTAIVKSMATVPLYGSKTADWVIEDMPITLPGMAPIEPPAAPPTPVEDPTEPAV